MMDEEIREEIIDEINELISENDWIGISNEVREEAVIYLKWVIDKLNDNELDDENESWWEINSISDFLDIIEMDGFVIEDWIPEEEIEEFEKYKELFN